MVLLFMWVKYELIQVKFSSNKWNCMCYEFFPILNIVVIQKRGATRQNLIRKYDTLHSDSSIFRRTMFAVFGRGMRGVGGGLSS